MGAELHEDSILFLNLKLQNTPIVPNNPYPS